MSGSHSLRRFGVVALAIAAAFGCAPQQQPTTAPAPQRAAGDVEAPTGDSAGARGRPGEPNPRPYARVITRDAQTQQGVFKTHRVGSKLFYEIPASELGEPFLLVTQIAKTTPGVGYGGQAVGNRVLTWERRDNRVYLRSPVYESVADTSAPVYRAVEAAQYAPIIAVFNVEAYGPDSAPVIDVTRLYTSDVTEMSARLRLRAGNLDQSRSFLERVAAYPRNIEVEATHTFAPQQGSGNQSGPQGPFARQVPRNQSSSVLMHWSMVKLPENPMTPRLCDRRVGYFSVRQYDFGRDEHRAEQRCFITRYRLEKQDPNAEISEPVEPIVYYIDPATPPQWVPWLKAGVEDWQRAFEAAGFRNAIVAREAPSPAEDPNWSPEDARYSVIRWLPSTIENASGPHVHDPRTGEILEADIQFYHNVQNLLRDWYWTQVGALDPRARTLPLPDSLMGRLIQYVTAHEVGHTLGFPHNMKASSTYPLDSLRSESFLRQYGHTPTLMDYSRFNYVAQPEDSIDVALLVPDIGPYDKYATMWGYAPIPGADTPDEERAVLDRWARMQDTIPYYRFMTSGANGSDPGALTEAVGDENAVRATELGIRNIRRLVPMLIPATVKPTEDFADLEEMYGRLVGQWAREMGHVVAIVAGAQSQEKYGGQMGVRFTPLARERQREAVRFLNENAFQTPQFFLDDEILRRIEVAGAIERIGQAQGRVLESLLDENRIVRLIEFEALAQNDARVYTVGDLMSDVRRGIWSELSQGRVEIDPFRRNLQRKYLEVIDRKLNPPEARERQPAQSGPQQPEPAAPSAARAYLRGELVDLDTALRQAVSRSADRATRLHLQDARVEIARILDPRN